MKKLKRDEAEKLFNETPSIKEVVKKNYKEEKLKDLSEILKELKPYLEEWSLGFDKPNELIFKSSIPEKTLNLLQTRFQFFTELKYEEVQAAFEEDDEETIYSIIEESFEKFFLYTLDDLREQYLQYFNE